MNTYSIKLKTPPPQIIINNANQQQHNSGMAYVPVIGKKVVNKTTYVLLALFFGGIGVHKFYEGKTFMGIMYLVFCWTLIPAFISFFEGIFALFKQSDEYGNIYL